MPAYKYLRGHQILYLILQGFDDVTMLMYGFWKQSEICPQVPV